MSSKAIIVENLSKSYLLRHKKRERYVALRDVITEKTKAAFRKQGETNFVPKEIFFALDDVSFDVDKGQRIGIIGRNGAGKSTLLKILSRIVAPTKGRITIEGRVASLLEVGTGFHPELTGSENIFLNGSILGMSKTEIRRKFDEIVDFSGVENFLDTPVKRYSSGMYVRLAFAVAAHLEPEILIVDEVLAVGDAQFQQKCIGKMEDVSKNDNRTVIFVSHNMQAVQKLCTHGLLLNKGRLIADGKIDDVIKSYLDSAISSQAFYEIPGPADSQTPAYAISISIENLNGNQKSEIPIGSKWQARVKFRVVRPVSHLVIALGVVTPLEYPIQTSWSEPQSFQPGEYSALFSNQDVVLTSGNYKLVVGLSTQGKVLHYSEEAGLLISDAGEEPIDPRIINTKSGIILNQMDVLISKI